MSVPKLHPDEVDIDESLIRRLVARQFPQWRDLPLSRVRSVSTDNALYRLGGDMVVRLPRLPRGINALKREQRCLPELSPHLPVPVPEPLGAGVPDEGFPFPWAVYRWMEGETVADARDVDLMDVATNLGRFVAAMQRIDTSGAPAPAAPWRSPGQSPEIDAEVRMRIRELSARGALDAGLVTAVWEKVSATPAWDGPPTWVHGDLADVNLLVRGSRLSGVIDFGATSVGNPAHDLRPAWGIFNAQTRDVFRAEIGVDDDTWARGRALAFCGGLGAWHVYEFTHPRGGASGKHAVNEILAEH